MHGSYGIDTNALVNNRWLGLPSRGRDMGVGHLHIWYYGLKAIYVMGDGGVSGILVHNLPTLVGLEVPSMFSQQVAQPDWAKYKGTPRL